MLPGWLFLSDSMQVSREGLSQKLAVFLVALKYLERVHLDKNQPQMLFLIDSVPEGFCGSRGRRYISTMLSKCPSLPLGLFLSSPPDFSCCARRAVGLEGNGDISTASCPGLFLYAKTHSTSWATIALWFSALGSFSRWHHAR